MLLGTVGRDPFVLIIVPGRSPFRDRSIDEHVGGIEETSFKLGDVLEGNSRDVQV